MGKAFKTIWILFVALNAVASFILLGMPKVYSNEAHFTALPIRTHYESIYSPLENMTIKDNEGKEHPMLSVILSLILIAFKCLGIVYFYLHPMVCL